MVNFWEDYGKNVKIGFLGCGNMGMAMLRTILNVNSNNNTAYSGVITIFDPAISNKKFSALKLGNSKVSVQLTVNLKQLLQCAVLIIAVKPQIFSNAVSGFFSGKPASSGSSIQVKLIVSIMAGISCKKIEEAFVSSAKINTAKGKPGLAPNFTSVNYARIMPNLPLTVGLGAGAYCYNENSGQKTNASPNPENNSSWQPSDIDIFLKNITMPMGTFLKVEEREMNAVTAVSGSGPAFFCAFLEEFVKAAKKNGLTDEVAQKLCLQTFVGTAQLLIANNETPESLRKRVTSPGGTTEAGLKALQTISFSLAIQQCITSAKTRGIELGMQK